MSDNPDTYTITTAAASGDGTGRNPYARILDLERQFAEARAKADALLAGLSAIIHCQSHLSRADMREAAADILDEAGLKPKWLDGDQSPFVQRALAAEAERDRLAAENARLRALVADITNTYDDSWSAGSQERRIGDTCRAALAGKE